MSSSSWLFSLALFVLGAALAVPANAQSRNPVYWDVHDTTRAQPPVVDPGPVPDAPQPPPSDAVVLFNGGSLDAWEHPDGSTPSWIVRNGYFEVKPGSGDLQTKRGFGDVQLHLEWMVPASVEGEKQSRGNSGVYLMGTYEVQILDSHNNSTYPDGQAAAIYGQYPPLVNATRPQGKWQTYDIVFRRPHFDEDGDVVTPARMTVYHNGVLVQDHAELTGPTAWKDRPSYERHASRLPLLLQDHGNPVRFRNVWVRDLE
ncbi:MAG: DUF1080 domain-containing protein [Salinibacter sp.]|uniref:DUF1080 domain-containing protein n=1 Tax=Salinibacter sp. TaxID=2065818 RepID=UPI0035D4D279